MTKLKIESYIPSFNRLDFIKYISENTENGLISSKKILNKIIDGEDVFFNIEDYELEYFVKELEILGVFTAIVD
ncbi:hypothetical protein [uncultured Tenacibaculum sp.]|uniref:hypothetical protein n=1 Tax=uncultured Tenacibaculum sp. TaxID=174713 RepID=UPI00262125D1|nr:hypothetical protein [uncultured Tenacibaculum sp.]